MKNIFTFHRLFVLSILLIMFLGCASSPSPSNLTTVSKNIINEVGIDKAAEFQYYISKTITLEIFSEDKKSTVSRGELVRTSSAVREKVIIKGHLPGVLRKSLKRPTPDGFQLNIAVEEYQGDPILMFGQYREGDDEKYYLLFNDPRERIIRYGNNRYKVDYCGSEAPYLKIKIKEDSDRSNKSRRARGVLLEGSSGVLLDQEREYEDDSVYATPTPE